MIECEPSTNSANLIQFCLIFETSLEMEFSSEYVTEMLLSFIFRPSVVKYDILSNKRCNKLHAVIDCLFFFYHFGLTWKRSFSRCRGGASNHEITIIVLFGAQFTSILPL